MSLSLSATRPALTEALRDAALVELERTLTRHAALLLERNDAMARYVEMVTSGVWATSCAAQDCMHEVVDCERQLRALEFSLTGGANDDRY